MKKILFLLLLGFIAAVSANAQVVEVYKNGTLVHSYNNTPDSKYTVKFIPLLTLRPLSMAMNLSRLVARSGPR